MNKETGTPSANDHPFDADAYFGLSEELFNAVNLKAENELDDIGNYLQKLHIKNHTVSSKEVVHDLFTDEVAMVETEHQLMSAEDEMLFEEIRDAVTEKEIIDLRSNLQSIAKSISVHERTFEEIEDLIDGELDKEIESLIREEAILNSALSNEIDLHLEINSAIEEEDIMQLRSTLKNMIRHEYSHSQTVEEIDSYLNEELDADSLALFEDELMYNTELAADLNFHKEVDKAIAETDVMALRDHLRDIAREQHDQVNEKRGIATPKTKNLFWYAAASVIVLMVVFTSLLRNKTYSGQQLYASYYQPYKSGEGVSRSAMGSYSGLNVALREINQGKYLDALKSMSLIPSKERDGYSVNFYSGVAYQELGEYNRAIGSFSEVVHHGDNLLVEQSEWYIGLCYLKIDERHKALEQFRLIASRKGFYGEQSNKLLKQLE
ncbi:MAG: hypothetical protein M0R39_05745 [Prolixibacteraceae bacterium]|jgi:hypothetical protein|nr:hypothetical protein [Prolixibacteraceae bacterium]